MIALITPTGVRADQFILCAKWMQRQDYKESVLWIIVDDGVLITTNCVQPGFRDNWEIVKVYPKPSWNKNSNTQGRNIGAGIETLLNNKNIDQIKAVFIIEDDDYYRANYLTEMMKRFGTYWLIGETNTIYYNVQWRQHCDNNNRQHSSLFQTAFTCDSIRLLLTCLNQKFIDADLWARATNKYLFHAGTLSVGIKGMPGREGIGAGHRRNSYFIMDESVIYLTQLIGLEDAQHYFRYYIGSNRTQHGLLDKKNY
jgi:hypothetical protein